MGGISISKTVLADKDSITSADILSWSESTAAYSGDWNTCNHINKRIKFADKYKKELSKADRVRLQNIVNQYCNKWESTVIDLGLVGYDVIKVKKTPKKATAKYQKKFVVYEGDCVSLGKRLQEYPTKPAAKEAAMKYAIQHGVTTFISEEMVQVSGSTNGGTFSVTRARRAKKPAKGDYKEVHAYYVIAIASC